MLRFASVVLCSVTLALTLTTPAAAQITNVDDTTSTPIPGAGHDYIHLLSETVNPANGSVSLRINVPVPKARGITIPFSFSYDSNSVNHLLGSVPNPGQARWLSNATLNSYLTSGGWSFSLPMVSIANYPETFNNSNYSVSLQCSDATNYVFSDPSGGQHSLGLGTQRWQSGGAAGVSDYNCPYSGNSVTTGGDAVVVASLPAIYNDQDNPTAPASAPVKVFTGDGTLYTFPFANNSFYSSPSTIEDRNGNIVNITDNARGTFSITDTAGRAVISSNGFGPAGATNTLTIGGLAYKVAWTTTTANFGAPPQNPLGSSGTSGECQGIPGSGGSITQTVVSKIILPNGQSYQFQYGTNNINSAFQNPYGLLNKIIYPDGGWVQYSYKWADQMNEFIDYPGAINVTCSNGSGGCTAPVKDGCLYQYSAPVVSQRQVAFTSSSNPVLTQSFTYSTNWSTNGTPAGTAWTTRATTVSTTDEVRNQAQHTIYTYSAYTTSSNDPLHSPLVTYLPQIPLEKTVQYYDFGGALLKTSNKTWNNQYQLASEQTQLPKGNGSITSQTTYSYSPQFSLVTAKNEWDYATTLPSTPTRMTTTTYQSFSGTPGYVADKACSVVVCSGGSSCTSTSSTKLSETDLIYDGSTGAVCAVVSAGNSTGQITGTLVAGTHDETNFSTSSPTPRGNVTKKVQWLKGGTSPTTSYAYDETGQTVSVTDPCGNQTCSDITGTNHTTTFSHADSYSSGTPTGQTNTYLTAITYPTTATGVTATRTFMYSYSDGQLTSSKDENHNPTTYKYNTPPTGCSYNDGLDRLTEIDYPDGGVTSNCYNDAAAEVTTSKLIDQGAGTYITTETLVDGLGHVVQTQLTSDPEGADFVDTSYDGFGRVLTTSNPHRSASSSSDGTAQYSYDGLGRTIAVKQPDGSLISTAYSVGCTANPSEPSTTMTDEAGNMRSSCSDGLGRLVEVDEPGTGATAGGFGIDTVTIGGGEQVIPAVSGSASVNVSGAGKCVLNGSVYVPDSGTVSITVYGVQTAGVTYPWNGGCNTNGNFTGPTASNIASQLATLLSSSAAGVSASSSPPPSTPSSSATITITSNLTGSGTNYGLSYACGGSCDFAAGGPASLTGGKNAITDSGTVSVTVGSFPVSYSYGASDSAESIASGLAGQFNDTSTSPVTAEVSGSTITITANVDGSTSNYSVTGKATWNTQYFATPSFNISDSSSTLTGGVNGSLGTAPLVTQYSYDLLGNLTCAVQKSTDTTAFSTCAAASSTWRPRSFTYDTLSRLTSAANPESGTITYSYDANGNAKQKKSPLPNQTSTSQVTTNYTFDVLNRLIQKSYAGMSGQTAIKFGYDGVSPTGCTPTSVTGATNLVGLRSSMCDAVGSAAFSFDVMGRTATEQHKINNVTKQIAYSYWADGELLSLIYPDGKEVTFTPRGNGSPGVVTDGDATFQGGFAYAPNGSISNVALGPNTNANAVSQTFYYNSRFQPAAMYAFDAANNYIASYCYDFHLPGGGTIGDLNLFCNFSVTSQGNNGNLHQLVNNLATARTANYKYDLLNRIQQAYTNGPNWGETYTIDAWGNLTNRGPVSGKTNYEPLAAPALTSNQLTGFNYDSAGNLTNDGMGNTYSYDAENRLVTAGGVTYSYDGDGNRVLKSNGTIYWRGLGDEVLAESNLTGTVSEEYVYINGKRLLRIDVPGGVDHLYFGDLVGSTTLITDINGNPQQQSDYYPYGGEIPISGSDPNHYKFNGKERDAESCAVGRCLDNFGARYYASAMGRFMTSDWAAKPTAVPYANFGNPQSLNLYSFVQNNPTTKGDPDGHCDPICPLIPLIPRAVDWLSTGHAWSWSKGTAVGQPTVDKAGPVTVTSKALYAEASAATSYGAGGIKISGQASAGTFSEKANEGSIGTTSIKQSAEAEAHFKATPTGAEAGAGAHLDAFSAEQTLKLGPITATAKGEVGLGAEASASASLSKISTTVGFTPGIGGTLGLSLDLGGLFTIKTGASAESTDKNNSGFEKKTDGVKIIPADPGSD